MNYSVCFSLKPRFPIYFRIEESFCLQFANYDFLLKNPCTSGLFAYLGSEDRTGQESSNLIRSNWSSWFRRTNTLPKIANLQILNFKIKSRRLEAFKASMRNTEELLFLSAKLTLELIQSLSFVRCDLQHVSHTPKTVNASK